ncbi:MAG: hypothetical protein H0T09_04860 [Actinobacteria bacterium]|nr:hypothetical protein [Actinomycetota bacterium]
MPSRKQRRRRDKTRRHEYEYVYVDAEGREVEVGDDEAEPPAKKASSTRARSQTSGRARQVEPPSWRRVIKRGLIFAPFMFLVFSLIARDLTLAGRLFQTIYLLVMFIPFSYLLDRMMYRRFLRQSGQAPTTEPSRRT